MRPKRVPGPTGIDPVSTAGGLSAVAGIASIGWPFFDGMTAALAALALLGWAIGGRTPGGAFGSRARAVVLVASVLGWGCFLLADGPFGTVRGLALGAAGGLVGWIGRRTPAFGGVP